MKRSAQVLLLLLVVSTAVGCLEYDEQLILRPDGSGLLLVHYANQRDMRFQNLYFPSDPYEIEEYISRNYVGEGVDLRRKAILQKGRWTHVYIMLQFSRLGNLNQLPRFASEGFRFIREGKGRWRVRRFLVLERGPVTEGALFRKLGINRVVNRELLAEVTFRFQWILPGKIVTSNATRILSDDVAVWEMTLDQLLKKQFFEFFVVFKKK